MEKIAAQATERVIDGRVRVVGPGLGQIVSTVSPVVGVVIEVILDFLPLAAVEEIVQAESRVGPVGPPPVRRELQRYVIVALSPPDALGAVRDPFVAAHLDFDTGVAQVGIAASPVSLHAGAAGMSPG